MFTITTHEDHDHDGRVVMTATTTMRRLARYSWTWTSGTQIAIADRAADTPFDTIGVYDHETGRIVIDTAESFAEFLTERYHDPAEIDELDATWNASLY